jgi:CubicO group peptidase (beta-lactamase class C family)
MALIAEKVDQLLVRAQREINDGLLPSCQLALALDGEVVLEQTFGDATPDTRYVMFSCTKVVVASAAWLLIADGALDTRKRVVDYIPEFMARGEPERRDLITVEQVMLHTSGFPHAPMGPDVWASRPARLARMEDWRCNWDPGTRYEYHPTSAHWVLAEIIERLAGVDYRTFITEQVLTPLGLTRLRVGVPPSEQGDIAAMRIMSEPATPDELEQAFGLRALPVTEVTDEALMGFNQPGTREVGVPGGGAVSTAADLARFYQALLHNPGSLWDPDVLHDATHRVRNNFPDPLVGRFGVTASRGLGVVIAGADGKSNYRGLGKTVSPGAFGHNGAAGQLAWADPATGLSFVYFTNGIDAHQVRQGRRGVALASIAGECAAPR